MENTVAEKQDNQASNQDTGGDNLAPNTGAPRLTQNPNLGTNSVSNSGAPDTVHLQHGQAQGNMLFNLSGGANSVPNSGAPDTAPGMNLY